MRDNPGVLKEVAFIDRYSQVDGNRKGIVMPLSWFIIQEAEFCKAAPETRTTDANLRWLAETLGADKLDPEHQHLLDEENL